MIAIDTCFFREGKSGEGVCLQAYTDHTQRRKHLYAEGEEHEDDNHDGWARDRLDIPLQVGTHGIQVDVPVKVPDVPTPFSQGSPANQGAGAV